MKALSAAEIAGAIVEVGSSWGEARGPGAAAEAMGFILDYLKAHTLSDLWVDDKEYERS